MLVYQLMSITLDLSTLVSYQAFVCGDVAEGPAAAAGGGDPDSAGESAERAGALQASAAGRRGTGAAAAQPTPETPA